MSNPSPPALEISPLETAARRAAEAVKAAIGETHVYVLVLAEKDDPDDAYVIANCGHIDVAALADMLSDMHGVETDH